MNRLAKTIQHFLPTGDPRGIRIAEITTRIVQVIEVPRSLLQDFLAMPESGQVAVYFLFGHADDSSESRVYIGQTGDLRARLTTHNKSKDFWQRVFVLVSRTNSLTQTHALFLEWHCLRIAHEVGRYAVENGNSGSKPHTPAPLEADCLEIFETAQVLLTTLGCPIFEAVAVASGGGGDVEVFYCKANGSNAKGLYTPEGFVVLKDSTGRRTSVPHLKDTSAGRFREKLVETGVMKEAGQKVVFPKDHLFGSPSMAAIALLGRVSNGWIEWKTEDGRTLDEVKRKGAQ